MEVLYLLIPLSLLMGTGGLLAFIWATKAGQWKDMERQGYEILNNNGDETCTPDFKANVEE